jgi:hypothetical protein
MLRKFMTGMPNPAASNQSIIGATDSRVAAGAGSGITFQPFYQSVRGPGFPDYF